MKRYILFLMIIPFSMMSCYTNHEIICYDYHEHLECNGCEIFSDNLERLFTDDSVYVYSIKSKVVYKTLISIKNELIEINDTITDRYREKDGDYYKFAFIVSKKDTLYTNFLFNHWRYKDIHSYNVNNFGIKIKRELEKLE
jgi:hypothetical protein